MFSQERRRERYQIIFIWKISQGLVQGYHLAFNKSDRRGLLALVPPLETNTPAAVRRARECTVKVKGARIFNLIPKDLRNLDEVSVDSFKAGLDSWLKCIPDQPTVPGRQRAALSNSLIDQVANHQRTIN